MSRLNKIMKSPLRTPAARASHFGMIALSLVLFTVFVYGIYHCA